MISPIMNLLKLSFAIGFLALFVGFNACKPADEETAGTYGSGVFITCDGAFPSGTGVVSFYNRKDPALTDIFAKENNGAALGNTVQSMSIYDGKAYIMVNNANKVVIVDAKTFQNAATVSGINYPNNFLAIDKTRAYVSEWGEKGLKGGVKIYDLVNKNFVKTILTGGYGAANMLRIGANVWVINNNGLNFPKTFTSPIVKPDSTISLIDSDRDSVVRTIKVGYVPNSMVQDVNGDVWVLCSGNNVSTGQLMKIRNGVVDSSFIFNVPAYSSRLTGDLTNSNLYFVSGNKVYQKDLINFGKTPPSVFLSLPYLSSPYSLGFDPKTGYMYCGDGENYSSAGTVYIFDPATKALKDSTKVGIAPNGFIFQ
jgi:DNA-binding beta-propeller fold protein YncE